MSVLPNDIIAYLFSQFLPASVDKVVPQVCKQWAAAFERVVQERRREFAARFALCLRELPRGNIYEVYSPPPFKSEYDKHAWAAKHVPLNYKDIISCYRTTFYHVCNWRTIIMADIVYSEHPAANLDGEYELMLRTALSEESCFCQRIIHTDTNNTITWEDVNFPRGTNPESSYPPFTTFAPVNSKTPKGFHVFNSTDYNVAHKIRLGRAVTAEYINY